MSAWTPTDRRIGLWSALTIVILGAAYVLIGIIWWATSANEGTGVFSIQPTGATLTLLEAFMILIAIALIPLMAAVHAFATPERRTCALIALGFTIIAAALTISVHVVQLSIVRQFESQSAPIPDLIARNRWPTITLALDLLAWCLMFGLAMLFAAPVFRGDKLQSAIRAAMIVSGLFCIAGTIAPATGHMQFAILGILGYDFGLLGVCILLAIFFGRCKSARANATQI